MRPPQFHQPHYSYYQPIYHHGPPPRPFPERPLESRNDYHDMNQASGKMPFPTPNDIDYHQTSQMYNNHIAQRPPAPFFVQHNDHDHYPLPSFNQSQFNLDEEDNQGEVLEGTDSLISKEDYDNLERKNNELIDQLSEANRKLKEFDEERTNFELQRKDWAAEKSQLDQRERKLCNEVAEAKQSLASVTASVQESYKSEKMLFVRDSQNSQKLMRIAQSDFLSSKKNLAIYQRDNRILSDQIILLQDKYAGLLHHYNALAARVPGASQLPEPVYTDFSALRVDMQNLELDSNGEGSQHPRKDGHYGHVEASYAQSKYEDHEKSHHHAHDQQNTLALEEASPPESFPTADLSQTTTAPPQEVASAEQTNLPDESEALQGSQASLPARKNRNYRYRGSRNNLNPQPHSNNHQHGGQRNSRPKPQYMPVPAASVTTAPASS